MCPGCTVTGRHPKARDWAKYSVGLAGRRPEPLFNNAGVSSPQTQFEDLRFARWQNVVDINLTSSFLCAQGAFKPMKAQAFRPNSAPLEFAGN